MIEFFTQFQVILMGLSLSHEVLSLNSSHKSKADSETQK